MELLRFCFKESSNGKTGRLSFCNFIRQGTSRVGCFTPSSNDRGVIVDCCREVAQSCNSHNNTPGFLGWECAGNPQQNAAIKKLDSNESTQIVLCCAMTESTKSPSAYAGSSSTQRKDDRIKKYPNKSESQNEKPMMCDVASQVPDGLLGICEVLPSGSSSIGLEDMHKVNDYDHKSSDKFCARSDFDRLVKSQREDSSSSSSAQSSSVHTQRELFNDRKKALSPKEDHCNVLQEIRSHSICDEDNRNGTPLKHTCPPVRQRILTQCHSADNLLPSSLLLDSSQSTPEVPPRSKKRSSSDEIMLGSKPRPSSVGHDGHSISKIRDQERKGTDSAVVHFSASAENLARQSLLAAQLLHLIPARKARERNYLHGRIAANSLLGTVELERVLPSRSVQIFVGTWNMNGQAPPSELNDLLLPEDLEHVPDILAFGTQESFPERFEWEVGIQETLGPSHVLLHSAALGTLHLSVFVRRDLIWFCSVAEEASFSVRPGTAFRTKGAVAIAFMLFGTSFLFVTSHLTAHAEKVKERLSDVKKIIRSLDLPKNLPCRHKNKDVTQNFDCVFWCGDLNFRLSQPREEVVDWVEKQQFPLLAPHKMEMDQLKNSILQGAVFRGFEEGPITFKPTYKYDPGTQMFDSSQKQRTPSYTDRILFKCRHTPRRASSILGSLPTATPSGAPFLECLKYSSVQSVCTSDHKPVWGLFRSHIRPGIDTIPLAAGLFNREVYVEGINRRAAAMDKREGSSTVCVVQ